MNNEELLAKRWKATDLLLVKFERVVSSLTKDLRNEILNLFDSVDIALTDLAKPISNREKERMNKLLKEWQKSDVNNSYLSYKIKTRKRKMPYSDYLELILLGLYAVYMQEVYEKSKDTFKEISHDAVKQAKEERGEEPSKPLYLTWKFIEGFLIVNTLQKPLYEYLQLLCQTNSDEAYKIYLQSKQAGDGSKISEEGLDNLMRKQGNRLIDIHSDKESGVFTDVSRQLWNEIYLEPYSDDDTQVRFIAEMDRATTEMCKGMDNMLFYTHRWNRYYRYSDLDKRDVLYTTFGLKVGENLPPINNHFHWCRSTVTYLINLSRDDVNQLLITDKERYALNKWRSFDFYEINSKMRLGKQLTEEEKQLVRDFNGYLNKSKNYTGNIIRVIDINGDALDKFVKEHRVGDYYIENSFLAFSTKMGYNPDAKVQLYVENSKFAKDIRQGTRSESEVVYRPQQLFYIVDYRYNNGIHMYLLEEIQSD